MRLFAFIILIVLVLLMSCNPSSDTVSIDLVIETPSMKEGEAVYIAGSHESIGNWQPDKVTLTQGEKEWRIRLNLPKGEEILYKFTRGTWETEATSKDGFTPDNHKLAAYSDTLIRHQIENWKDLKHKVRGQVTGNVKTHKGVQIDGLKERDVLVWLPPNYEAEKGRRYPVLYMHDGQNVFDPRTSTLERDWQIDELADSLIRNDIIEPIIVVAIYCNPENRRAEYAYEELGDLYQKFMVEKLKPMIDDLYRTKTDREHTAVMGASMGGLISFILAWEQNETFKHAACLSPAFKVVLGEEDDLDYVAPFLAYDGAAKDMNLYIDNGTEGLEKVLQPGIDDMLKALDQKGYAYKWVLDQGAAHNEIAWSERAPVPLKMFFGKAK